MTAPTGQNYFGQFLAGLGIQDSAGAEAALESVRHYEGNNSRYNPLNVIQPEPGSTNFNSVGVQSYQSFDTGVAGGVALFQGSHWAGVRQALAGGNEQQILSAFDQAYTWSPGTNIPALSSSNLATESALSVGPNSGSGNFQSAVNATNASDILPGGSYDPFNWPTEILGGAASDTAKAVISGLEGIIGTITKPLVNFAENAFLIVFGAIVVLVGFVLLAKAGMDSASSSSSPTPAPAASGGSSKEAAGGEAAGGDEAALALA